LINCLTLVISNKCVYDAHSGVGVNLFLMQYDLSEFVRLQCASLACSVYFSGRHNWANTHLEVNR